MTAIFTMLEENLAVPFVTAMPGAEVTVERVDLNKTGEIVAVCRRGREKLRIPVIDLPLPKFGLKGAEWIDAYRRWTELVKTPHSEIEPSQKDLLPLPPRSLVTSAYTYQLHYYSRADGTLQTLGLRIEA